jgi:hypothetical protein
MTIRCQSGLLLSLLLTSSLSSPVVADERQTCDSLNGARIIERANGPNENAQGRTYRIAILALHANPFRFALSQ